MSVRPVRSNYWKWQVIAGRCSDDVGFWSNYCARSELVFPIGFFFSAVRALYRPVQQSLQVWIYYTLLRLPDDEVKRKFKPGSHCVDHERGIEGDWCDGSANTNRAVALAFHWRIRSAIYMIIGNSTNASNVGDFWIRPIGSNIFASTVTFPFI